MPVWIRLADDSIPLDHEDAEDLYEALRERAGAEASLVARKLGKALDAEAPDEVVLSADEKRELFNVVRETEVEPSLRPFAEALEVDVLFFGDRPPGA
jgi:hypothetical protein